MIMEKVAKIYLLFLTLINCSSILGLISINEPLVYPSVFYIWAWNLIFFLVYLLLPVVAVATDNYISYVAFSGISILRIILDFLKMNPLTTDLSTILTPLYALAAILCLFLAADKVSSEVSGEILSLAWSQF